MTTHRKKSCVSLYDELGLTPEVSPIEIRERFLWLVKATHPDLGGELADLERYKRVLAAHYVLRDYWRRRRYDEFLVNREEFDPFLTPAADRFASDTPPPNNANDSASRASETKNERPNTGYRFFFGRKQREEAKTGSTSSPEADATTETSRESSDAQKRTGEEPLYGESSRDGTTRDESTRAASPDYEFEPEFDSTFQQSQSSQSAPAGWSGPRTTSFRRKRSPGIPWLAIGAQIFAIIFGALCAGVIAHFVLLWLRPESGGLRGIFGS